MTSNRILEIEYAVKNGLEFKPEPKRKKGNGKTKKLSEQDASTVEGNEDDATLAHTEDDHDDGETEADADTDGIAERVRQRRGPFGEATNSHPAIASPTKRGAATPAPVDSDFVASPKKRRTETILSLDGENAHEDVDDFGVKFTRAVSTSPNKLSSPTKRSRSQSQLSPRKRGLASVSPTKRSVSAGAGAVPHIVFGA